MKKAEFELYLEKLKQKYSEKLINLNHVAGYFCLYTPPEIIETCGFIPIRVMEGGNHNNEVQGSRFIRNDSCSFCKAALGYLKNNIYSCIISGTSCDQVRRIQEILQEKFKIPIFLFNNPRTYGKESTTDLYRREIKWLIDELTEISTVAFSEKILKQRVNKWNMMRKFLKKIDDYRKKKYPIISGTEMFNLVATAYFLGPDSFLPEIPNIENIVSRGKKYSEPPVRIFITGSILTFDDRIIHNLIEENKKAIIVGDLACTGTRWFNYLINETGDIFNNICDYYHMKMMCPVRRSDKPLYDFADEQISKMKPDGIIYRTLKFCHPWSFEIKTFKDRFNLPLLHLDTDYSNSNIGQLRTRISAFLEMINQKKK